MNRFVGAWARACLTYRKTVLAVLAAITAVAVAQLPKVHFNNAIETWFMEGDSSLRNHERLLDTFGSDTIIVIGIEAPDVFAPELLERIDRATQGIEEVPNVEKVFSLTSVEAITGKPHDLIEVANLVEFPLDDESLARIRERALGDDLYVGNVVSADARFTAIVVRLEHHDGGFDYKIDAVKDVRAVLEREIGDDYYLAGGPAFDEQFFYQSEADSVRMMVLMLALLVVILWMLLRTVWGVVLPIVTVGVAILWTIAAMVLSGVRINIITTMLPPLLLAVGVADVTHVLVEYQNRCRAGAAKLPALRGSFEELFGPLFVTACTTAIGMLSLTVSRIEAIREFGIFAGAGVVFAFFLTVTFVPIVLSYRPAPPAGSPAPRGSYISTRALEALHRFNMARGPVILAVAISVLAVAIGLATRVSAESSFLKIFKESAKVRQDTERIQDELGGTITIDVMVDTGLPDGVKDPSVLRRLAALEEFLKAQPGVSNAQSVVGYFKSLRRAFHGNDPHEYRLPDTREEAAQYLLLYEMDAPAGEMDDFVTLDYRQARVTARVNMESSNSAAALAQATDAYITKNFPPGFEGTVSGLLVMYADLEEYIRNSLIQGFSVALFSIFIVFCLQMRSIGLGTIMMIANSMPIVITLAVMGLLGIHLDSMTAMVASVAIGLADDDSIHFMSRVRSKLEAGIPVAVALRDAVVEVGRALVYSGLALCAGFAVMLTASFLVAIYFGLLVMLTIVISLVADLVLLPVMLNYYESWRRGMPVARPVARDVVTE